MSLIFEFETIDQAKNFCAAVKKQFGLSGQTFHNQPYEAHVHDPFPLIQMGPVAHICRPPFETKKDMQAAPAIERDIVALASLVFKGEFLGT